MRAANVGFFRHPWVRHLRVPFNLMLSPIYLWGVLLAGGSVWNSNFWLAYLSLHLFLYTGTTAFNSYYDKDEGPIAGMLSPPPVDPGLLGFSLVVQGVGFLLALFVNPVFATGWVILFLIASAYSHPLVRLKQRPYGALIAVGVGQGVLGFALGWLAVDPNVSALLAGPALLGMFTTMLILSGLYLISQSYQTAEDEARGDLTLSVMLGPQRALYLATGFLTVGGVILLFGVMRLFGLLWVLVLGVCFALIGLGMLRWARHFDQREVITNYRWAMGVTALSSSLLTLFLLAQLL